MLVRPLCAALLAAFAVGCAHAPTAPAVTSGDPPGKATIGGLVHDEKTGAPIAGALVILECACLPDPRETWTDRRGVYGFVDLPPGEYTVKALFGHTAVRRDLQLAPGEQFTARFAIDQSRPPPSGGKFRVSH